MNYPESLKKGDTIGICAPSGGITKIDKIKKLEEAIKQLEEMGYNVIETESVRKEEKGRSNTAKKRAEEFMQLLKNDSVNNICNRWRLFNGNARLFKYRRNKKA